MICSVLILLVSLFLVPYTIYLLLFLTLLMKKNDETTECGKARVDYEPFVSLVTATYNEEETISRKLENTFQLDYPPEKMEVIVVDSSSDNTSLVVQEWISKCQNVKLVREECRRGLASALNLAYSMAKGEIIVKSDCDILLEKDSVRQLVSNFANPGVGAVSGKQLLVSESKHETGYRNLIDTKRLIENQIDSIYLLEPFSAFRKCHVEPIDERSVADDAELGIKIRKKGYKVYFDPKAYFYEEMPLTLRKRLRIKQRRAQGHIRLVLKNLDILFNPKFGKYGFVVFPLNFYMITIAPWISVLISSVLLISAYQIFGLEGVSVVSALYLLLVLLYNTGNPKFLSGFIDSQLAIITGSINLAVKGPSYMWRKSR